MYSHRAKNVFTMKYGRWVLVLKNVDRSGGKCILTASINKRAMVTVPTYKVTFCVSPSFISKLLNNKKYRI